jgi:hypothetical protein
MADVTIMHATDSVTLMPFLTGNGTRSKNYAVSEIKGSDELGHIEHKSISDDTWKLIEIDKNKAMNSSLFDLNNDRAEKDNLYHEKTDICEELQEELKSVLEP